MALEPVDAETIPQLCGIFGPVMDEIDAGSIEVVQGRLPDDLAGCYLRNGPNPRFTPLGSYTYPLDGDAMLHGIWFDGGTARYSNRFVRTPALEAEERAGRALWPGVMSGLFPDPADVGEDQAFSIRDMVDIHVVRHAGHVLALSEGSRAFEVDDQLATVGPYTFGGALPKGICAHPRIDPDTGEMVVFRYDPDEEPRLCWTTVGPDGTVTHPEQVIEIDAAYMIHDCVITPQHLVLFVCPLRFNDMAAMGRGEPLLAWQPERGTRIVVVDRATNDAQWFETDPLWVWHFANGFSRTGGGGGTEIVIDLPIWTNPSMGLAAEPPTGSLVRAVLDLDGGTARIDQVLDETCEFPRIDDRRTGLAHRWYHTAAKDPDDVPYAAGMWNRLIRYDTHSGDVAERRGGPVAFGEAIFAPRAGTDDEAEGYILTYTYDTRSLETHLVVLHAGDVAGEPAATLRMPQRVPLGLHGSWIPS